MEHNNLLIKPGRPLKQLKASREFKGRDTPWRDKTGIETVNILLGVPGVLYRVPRQKLCRSIPFFETLLDHCSEIQLPDFESPAFDLLMEFVDSDNKSIRAMGSTTDSDNGQTTSWDPISFFSLAEKCKLPVLQDLIMDTIIDYHTKNDELPSPYFALRAYKCTQKGSAISKYARCGVEYAVRNGGTETGWPKDQVVTLLQDDTFASDHVDSMRYDELEDPREMDRGFFYATSTPGTGSSIGKKRSA